MTADLRDKDGEIAVLKEAMEMLTESHRGNLFTAMPLLCSHRTN